MTSLFPEGLTQKEFDLLCKCLKESSDFSIPELLSRARTHLENVRIAHKENIFINLKLAEAIFNTMKAIVERWEMLPHHAHPWLRGMMTYFTLTSDLESDFTSPIGFDDDVQIMNACLSHAGLEDLCLNPEDFDDV